MNHEEKDFVDWYKKYMARVDPSLPCLKCKDETIIRCSNTNGKGCFDFTDYIRRVDHQIGDEKCQI